MAEVKCRVGAGILLLALLAPCAARAGDWTAGDSYRQAAVIGLQVIDWGQTRYIAKHPEQFHEIDSRTYIGANPSVGEVNVYFAAEIIGHAAVSYVLPPDWRAGWQYVWIGVELNTVSRNRAIGVRVEF